MKFVLQHKSDGEFVALTFDNKDWEWVRDVRDATVFTAKLMGEGSLDFIPTLPSDCFEVVSGRGVRMVPVMLDSV